MWNTFLSLFNGGVRAYKVQSADRGTRVGVTARSLEDLVRKGREKLKVRLRMTRLGVILVNCEEK